MISGLQFLQKSAERNQNGGAFPDSALSPPAAVDTRGHAEQRLFEPTSIVLHARPPHS